MIWSLLSGVLLLLGSILIVIGALGLVRLPDFFTRLHAASVTDTLGALLVAAGLAIHSGLTLTSLKLGMILLFLLITGPTATHALAKAALHGRMKPRATAVIETSDKQP